MRTTTDVVAVPLSRLFIAACRPDSPTTSPVAYAPLLALTMSAVASPTVPSSARAKPVLGGSNWEAVVKTVPGSE